MKATWENTIIAESDKTVVVEGNHYFPPDSIKREYFSSSDTHTTCPWKGVASYYHVRIGELQRGANHGEAVLVERLAGVMVMSRIARWELDAAEE